MRSHAISLESGDGGGGGAQSGEDAAFRRMLRTVKESGCAYLVHAHAATRTIDEAGARLSFEVSRIVKTIGFRTREGRIILAALRGTRRVDYPKLAALLGISRRDLAPLSPEEVRTLLGVEPGGVSPLLLRENADLFLDSDILAIRPTLYCGTGRPDRTFELSPEALVAITGAPAADFSKE